MKRDDLLARVGGVKPVAITEPSLRSTAVSPSYLTRARTLPRCTIMLSSRRRNTKGGPSWKEIVITLLLYTKKGLLPAREEPVGDLSRGDAKHPDGLEFGDAPIVEQ